MEITRERIENRRAQLAAQRDRLTADLNAIAGAVQLCDLLLTDLDAPEPTPPTANPEESK